MSNDSAMYASCVHTRTLACTHTHTTHMYKKVMLWFFIDPIFAIFVKGTYIDKGTSIYLIALVSLLHSPNQGFFQGEHLSYLGFSLLPLDFVLHVKCLKLS